MAAGLLVWSNAGFAADGVGKAEGGAIDQVRVAFGQLQTTTSSIDWVNVPGAALTITVPTGGALVLARFTAESSCKSTTAADRRCMIQLTATAGDTVVVLAPHQDDFAFDSTNPGAENIATPKGHAVDRSLSMGAGTWRINVQRRVSNADTTFALDDWHLTVMRAPLE